MDIFIIGVEPRLRETPAKLTKTTTTTTASSRPRRLGPNWSHRPPLSGSPRGINIDENDAFIRERQVRPRLKSREIYRDAASRRQPFPSGSYIKFQRVRIAKQFPRVQSGPRVELSFRVDRVSANLTVCLFFICSEKSIL